MAVLDEQLDRAQQRRVERAREPARSGRPGGRTPRVGQLGFARRRRLDDILDDGASVGDEEAGVARADDIARRCEGDAGEMEPRPGHNSDQQGAVGLVDRRRDVRDLLALVRLGRRPLRHQADAAAAVSLQACVSALLGTYRLKPVACNLSSM